MLSIDLETDCLVEGTEYFDLSVHPISDDETRIILGDKSRTRVVITDINGMSLKQISFRIRMYNNFMSCSCICQTRIFNESF